MQQPIIWLVIGEWFTKKRTKTVGSGQKSLLRVLQSQGLTRLYLLNKSLLRVLFENVDRDHQKAHRGSTLGTHRRF